MPLPPTAANTITDIVVRADGVHVQFNSLKGGTGELQFNDFAHLGQVVEQRMAELATDEILAIIALAQWQAKDPTFANKAQVTGKTCTMDLNAVQPIRVV